MKKIVSLMLILSLFAFCCAASFAAAEDKDPAADAYYRYCVGGDLDGSGKITSSDARSALRLAAKQEQPGANEKAADLNGDGRITAAEARRILRCAAKLEPLSFVCDNAPEPTGEKTTVDLIVTGAAEAYILTHDGKVVFREGEELYYTAEDGTKTEVGSVWTVSDGEQYALTDGAYSVRIDYSEASANRTLRVEYMRGVCMAAAAYAPGAGELRLSVSDSAACKIECADENGVAVRPVKTLNAGTET